MEKQEYYLGLDMGTGSVGWAVTDNQYKVIKKHGKALWGSRLFETASTAEERRTFRTGRRRTARKKQRIELLQELFSEAINDVDPGFYLRLKESKYWPEDKKDAEGNTPDVPYALFADDNFTDKDYYKKFPTIYHLRKALINQDDVFDVRLVYLAIHHILKHRGHFLFEGKNISSIKQFTTVFDVLIEQLAELEIIFDIEDDAKLKIEAVLKEGKIGKTAKKTELVKLFQAKDKQQKTWCALLSGGKVNLCDLFEDEQLKDVEVSKICFSEASYEENALNIESELEEKFIAIEAAKAVYDWALLADMLGDYSYLSEAKVAIYEKHKQDLKQLKNLLKGSAEYDLVFGQPLNKEANYSAYIGMGKKNGKKYPIEKQCTKQEFYDYLKKKILPSFADMKETTSILEDMESESFMPKQLVKDNGVIPYQLHAMELEMILKNAGKYLSFLNLEDEEGYTIAQKCMSILTFRIPYYVGPINTNHRSKDGNCWAVRKTEGKVYPWNFKEKIDEEKSATEFIRRMTNKCTYLVGKDVLPKDSLLYSKFMVLNELNNLKINDEKISVELKQNIYEQLFEKTRKVTGKKLKNWLLKEGVISKEDEISGIDGDFKNGLKSYIDFKELLTGISISNREKEVIIQDIALFGDARKLLKSRIKKYHPEFTENQIKRLSELSYSGWGALSREFLEEIVAPNPETGEAWNIITALWETNDNMMQLLSKKYQYVDVIEEFNMQDIPSGTISYENVQDMYVSPAVKRPIWQTIQIVNEVEKIMGMPPKRIFVEMAREKTNDGRKMSRKKALQELYLQCKKEEPEWLAELDKTEENRFRSDKLYLYYTQKGRCMYSGEVIDLEDLYDQNKYDIDHIYPQSKVMDDSLNNRVLVKKEWNAEKSDIYPIKGEIRAKQKLFWKALLDGGFISKEKYQRLTRATEFDDGELAGFIERQLVETRQSTKAVAELLGKAYPDSDIVYVKAKNVSQFRQEFDLIKVRELNDFHHAKDAYLNVVVGNTYYVKFTKDAAWFVKNNPGRSYNLKRMFTYKDVKRGDETAWIAGEQGSIAMVKTMMRKNNVMVTRRAYEVKGGLFDQQIMKKGKGQIPIKGSDERLANIEKYGAYNKASGAYFMLVKSVDKKGNEKRSIEYVPVYRAKEIEQDENVLNAYCTNELGLVSPEVLIKKIKIDSLIEVDGFRMHLSGRTGNRLVMKCAKELVISPENEKILKKVINYVNRSKIQKDICLSEKDNISNEVVNQLYISFVDKIKTTAYKVKLESQIATLEDGMELFEKLSLEQKCLVLYEILHIFQCQSGAADLRMINGPGHAGVLVLSNDITKANVFKVINQSITGFYENVVDLKEI